MKRHFSGAKMFRIVILVAVLQAFQDELEKQGGSLPR
jgi:hypothetical protein